MRTRLTVTGIVAGWSLLGCGVGVVPAVRDGEDGFADERGESAVDADQRIDALSTVDLAIQIMGQDFYPVLRPQADVFVRIEGHDGQPLFDGRTDVNGRVPSVYRSNAGPFTVTAGRRDLGLISVVRMTDALVHPITFSLSSFRGSELIIRPPAQSATNRVRINTADERARFQVSTDDCTLNTSFENPRLFDRECIRQLPDGPLTVIAARTELLPGSVNIVHDVQVLTLPPAQGLRPTIEFQFRAEAPPPERFNIPIVVPPTGIYANVGAWSPGGTGTFVRPPLVLGQANVGTSRIDNSEPLSPRFAVEYWQLRPTALSFALTHERGYYLHANFEIAPASPVFRLPQVQSLERRGRTLNELRANVTGSGFSRLIVVLSLGSGQGWHVIDASGTLRELGVPSLPAGMSRADLQGDQRMSWTPRVIVDGDVVRPWNLRALYTESAFVFSLDTLSTTFEL